MTLPVRRVKIESGITSNSDREIIPMEKISPEKIAKISLQVNAVPQAVHVSALFSLDAHVTNAANETLSSVTPYSVDRPIIGLR
jgi:hypothetical protein